MQHRSLFALWNRFMWRQRRGGLGLLAVVVASTAALAWLAAVGADRTLDAFDRLRQATNASDLYVNFSDADGVTEAELVRRAQALPGVAAVDQQVEIFVSPSFDEMFPSYNFVAFARTGAEGAVPLDVPVMVAGRAADPSRADEMVVSESYARRLGARPGDVVQLESVTDAWVEQAFAGLDPGPPDGPEIVVTVTGVARTPMDRDQFFGIAFLTPAFAAEYRSVIRTYERTALQLATSADALALAEGDNVDLSNAAQRDQARDALNVISTTWWVVCGLVLVAGGALAALVARATVRSKSRDAATLAALGSPRRQVVACQMAALGPLTLAASAVGVIAGTLVSPVSVVGLVRSIDPAEGSLVVSVGVLAAIGAVVFVTAVVVLGVAVWPGARVQPPSRSSPQRWPILTRPIPEVLGTRDALGPHVDLWRALFGALAIAGLVAALTVAASIRNLGDDPSLSGAAPGRLLDSGESTEVLDQAMGWLSSDERIEFSVALHVFFPTFEGGRETTALALDVLQGQFDAPLVGGRIPLAADEVALGPATLADLGLAIGDEVGFEQQDGSAPVRYTIVGSPLFPQGDFDFDDGAAMTVSGAERLIGPPHDNAAIHFALYDWEPGVDGDAADLEVGATRPFTAEGVVAPPVRNLGEVVGLVVLVGILFAVLAVASLSYACLLGERRRRHAVATLQALGAERNAGSRTVAAHAVGLFALAVGVGLPVGVILGMRIWTRLAENAHVIPVTAFGGPAILLSVGATGFALVLTTLWPLLSARRSATDELRRGA